MVDLTLKGNINPSAKNNQNNNTNTRLEDVRYAKNVRFFIFIGIKQALKKIIKR